MFEKTLNRIMEGAKTPEGKVIAILLTISLALMTWNATSIKAAFAEGPNEEKQMVVDSDLMLNESEEVNLTSEGNDSAAVAESPAEDGSFEQGNDAKPTDESTGGETVEPSDEEGNGEGGESTEPAGAEDESDEANAANEGKEKESEPEGDNSVATLGTVKVSIEDFNKVLPDGYEIMLTSRDYDADSYKATINEMIQASDAGKEVKSATAIDISIEKDGAPVYLSVPVTVTVSGLALEGNEFVAYHDGSNGLEKIAEGTTPTFTFTTKEFSPFVFASIGDIEEEEEQPAAKRGEGAKAPETREGVTAKMITVTFDPTTDPKEPLAPITIEVEQGTEIGNQLPGIPEIPGYNPKWVVQGTTTEITSKTTVEEPFTAVVDKGEKITYTVTFVQKDGTTATRTTDIDKGFAINDLPEVAPIEHKIGKWVYPETTNEFTVGTVITDNLTVEAYYEQNIFTVTFMVDNAQYSEMTTATGTNIVLPTDPIKSGATFRGWFTEPDGQGTQYDSSSTVAQDLTLYAYFEGQVTVKFLVKDDQGDVITEKSQYFVDLTVGDQITTLPDDPFIENKVFDHWEHETAHTPVTVGTTVTETFNAVAVFKKIETYELTVNYYYYNDLKSKIDIGTQVYDLVEGDFPYTVTAPGFTSTDEYTAEPVYYPSRPTITVNKSDFTLDEETGKYVRVEDDEFVAADTNYTVKHWLEGLNGGNNELIGSEDKVGVENSIVTPNYNNYPYADPDHRDENVTLESSGTVLNVYYSRKDFTLSYNVGGGAYIEAVTAPYGTLVPLPETATRAGYAFDGWYTDEDYTQAAAGPYALESNATLYAKWNAAQVDYKIVYMVENADDDGYSFLKDVTKQAATDTELTLTAAQANEYAPSDLDKNNFTFKESSTEKIKADGSSVIVVKYSRNVYTLKWNGNRYHKNGNRWSWDTVSGSGEVTAKYGATITADWQSTFNTPYPNYAWALTQENNDKIMCLDTMPGRGEKWGDSQTTLNFANDVQTVYAFDFSTNKTQTLNYWLENYEGSATISRDEKTYGLYKTVTGKFNYLYDGADFYEINGYTKDGYDAKYTSEDWIGGHWEGWNWIPGHWEDVEHDYTLGNGTPEEDLNVNFYYAAKTHDLTFYNYDGTLLSTQQVKLNADISGYLTGNVPGDPMEGAEWLGWFTDAEHENEYSGGNKMPAGLVLYGNFSFPTRTVTYESQGGSEVESETDEYGFYATTPEDPTKTNYTFQGWFTAADETGSPYDWNQPVTEDITLYAHWSQDTISYRVHYYEKGTTTSVLPDKVMSDPTFRPNQEITENAPTVAGHVPDEASKKIPLTFGENEIIFYYESIPNVITYTVNYVIQGTDIKVAESKTVTVPGSTTNALEFAKEVDTNYLAEQTSDPEILSKHYKPKESSKELQLAISGNELTFEYVSYTTTKITVNYLDMDGNSVHDSDTSYVEKGDTFTVQNKAPDGYVYHHSYLDGTTTPPQATYQITGNEGNLVINIYYQRKLIIIANNKAKTYDGEALYSSFDTTADYTVTGNMRGDTLTSLEFDGSQTDAGTSATTPKNAQISKGAQAITDPETYYSIVYVPGSLTVKPVSVYISVSADQWNTHSAGSGPNYYTGQTFNVGFTNPNKNHFNDPDLEGSAYVSITSGQRDLFKAKYGDAIWNALYGTNGALISQKDAGTYTVTGAEQRAMLAAITVDGQPMMSDPNYSITLYARDSFLTIVPLPLTITTPSDEKAYDGTALTKSEGATLDHSYWTANIGGTWTAAEVAGPGEVALGTGDTITFNVTGSQTPVGTSDNTYSIDWGSAKAGNYRVNATLGALTVTSGTLKITVKDATKTYNSDVQEGNAPPASITGTGETIETDEYKIEGLAEGQVLTVSGYEQSSGKNVNTYENGSFEDATITVTIPDEPDIDVTNNYSISTVAGKLSITKAPLTITADSATKPYDGTPLTDDGWNDTAPTGLKGTDAVESVTVTGTITEVGTEENVASGAVVKNGETDVTANYEITYNKGTLEVTQSTKPLVITSSTKSWEYDAENHTDEVYTVTYDGTALTADESGKVFTLPTGDTVTITPSAAGVKYVADSAEKNNTYTYELDNDNSYSNVTANFGTLTINKRAVTVTITGSRDSKVYNGEEQKTEGYEAEISDALYTKADFTGPDEAVAKGTNVGSYEMGLAEEQFTNSNGNFDVTFNVTDGELKITAATLEIKVIGQTYVYNGYPQGESDPAYDDPAVIADKVEVEGLVGKDTLSMIQLFGQQTEVDVYEGEIELTGYMITRDGADVGGNYVVTSVPGTLEITPAQVTVTITGSRDSKVYNGEEQKAEGYEVSISDPLGLYTKADFTGPDEAVAKGTNVGKYPMKLSEDQFTNKNKNFDVTFSVADGELEITPADITDDARFKVSGPEDVMYNGDPQELVPVVTDSMTGKDLAATDFTVSYSGDTTNSGTVTVTITAAEGSNYTGQVTRTYKITPRSVTMTSADDSKVYDGKALTNHNVSVSGDGFVKDEGATFDVTGSQTLVGTSNNTFTYALNSSTRAINYVITMAEGLLRVTDGTGPNEPPVNPDDVGKKTHLDREYRLGETVTWTITATNIYDEAKTITLVEKDGFILAQSTFADVAPGATISTTATHVVTEADIAAGEINNSVQVQFEGGTSVVIPDPVPVTPENPSSSISVAKTPSAPANGQTYNVGDTITYTITITNTGNQTLSNVAIADSMRGISGLQPVLPYATIASLAPGPENAVVMQVTYQVVALDAGNSLTNTATVTTTDPNDPTRTITSTVTTPGEPVTAPTPTPVPPTPTPTPFVPVTPAAAVPATPAAPAVTPVADNPTPQAESINDDGNALGEGEGTWSLFDLIATVLATILAAIMLILAFGRNRKEGDDEETAAAKTANGEEVESDEVYKRKRLGRVLSVIPAAASIVLFILTQDMTQPMAIFDQWSIVFGIIGIINIVLAIVTRKTTKNDGDDEQQQAPQSGFVPAGPASL